MNTKKILIEKDMQIYCLTVKSFPDGIVEAHQNLHKNILPVKGRNYYGISYCNEKDEIIYKAGAEEIKANEFKHLELETFIAKKGSYISITVTNYENNISNIKEVFDELKKNPNIDPKGVALEWYSDGPDCKCMIRLKDGL